MWYLVVVPAPAAFRSAPGRSGVTMNTAMPSTASLYLVVGYDGSAPATRALDAAIGLLRGRTGSIEVVYVAHLTTAEMMSADAIAEMEVSFSEIARELRAQADEQLRGREDRWEFKYGQGMITDVLIKAAEKLMDANPGDNV